MIKYWPDTDKYKDRPELIASLEHQVCRLPTPLPNNQTTPSSYPTSSIHVLSDLFIVPLPKFSLKSSLVKTLSSNTQYDVFAEFL